MYKYVQVYDKYSIFSPYAAVFFAKSKLDQVLRETEPARHNAWDFNQVNKDYLIRESAQKACRDIPRKIKEKLKSLCNVTINKTIDAAGAAEYLPISTITGPQEGGTDIMKPIIRIGGIKSSKSREKAQIDSGKPSKGQVIDGTVHNNQHNPMPDNPEHSVPVGAQGDARGVSPGSGGKLLNGTKSYSGISLNKSEMCKPRADDMRLHISTVALCSPLSILP